MKQRFLYTIFILLFSRHVEAQDIRGAYIRTNWIPYTNTFTPVYQYSVTVLLLTDANINVPRPVVTVTFTFGQTETYSLTSSVNAGNGIIVKTYSGTHTFPGPNPEGSYYSVQYIDSFLVAGIKNMTASHTQPVCAEARLVADHFVGAKNSGTITNFPPVLGVSGNVIFYDPAFISTNDSVSYTLLNYCNPLGYYIPNEAILSPTSGVLTIPKDTFGLYAINLKINEWVRDITSLMRVRRTTYADLVVDINQTVGIAKNDKPDFFIGLFPNPNDGTFELKLSESSNDKYQYEIYDAVGRKVDHGTTSKESGYKIDVTGKGFNGIYFLNLKSEKTQNKFKFIVQ